MGLIVLLRHGQASFGAADYDNLSDLGREQASLAGTALATRGLRNPVITSGTLRRQVDTAALATRAMSDGQSAGGWGGTTPGRPDARWNEYDHVAMVQAQAQESGAMQPEDSRAFQLLLDQALEQWITADEPGGWKGFKAGAVDALADLARDMDAGQDAVVATSGGVIAAVCAHLLELGAPGVIAMNRVVVNASFTTVAIGSRGPSLISFNDHAHVTGNLARLRSYR